MWSLSSFYCPECGAVCLDTEKGYMTGCEHYPPDIVIHDQQNMADKQVCESIMSDNLSVDVHKYLHFVTKGDKWK